MGLQTERCSSNEALNLEARPKEGKLSARCWFLAYPGSPGTHIVGPWVIDSISSYRDLRTGTQYIGNWASRVR